MTEIFPYLVLLLLVILVVIINEELQEIKSRLPLKRDSECCCEEKTKITGTFNWKAVANEEEAEKQFPGITRQLKKSKKRSK